MTTGRWCDTCRRLHRPTQVTHYPLQKSQEAAHQGNKHIPNFQALRRLLSVMIHMMHYLLYRTVYSFSHALSSEGGPLQKLTEKEENDFDLLSITKSSA